MKNLIIILFLFPQPLGNPVLNIIESTPKLAEEAPEKNFVTLTTYSPSATETDSAPNITASGFKIDSSNPAKHRIIAVSRDLKKRGFHFGKKVRIRKAGKFNGVYTVRDLMNKRHKKRIDILVSSSQKPIKLSHVEVVLIN